MGKSPFFLRLRGVVRHFMENPTPQRCSLLAHPSCSFAVKEGRSHHLSLFLTSPWLAAFNLSAVNKASPWLVKNAIPTGIGLYMIIPMTIKRNKVYRLRTQKMSTKHRLSAISLCLMFATKKNPCRYKSSSIHRVLSTNQPALVNYIPIIV